MVKFKRAPTYAGWKLAHESEAGQLAQGVVDCLRALLDDDGRHTDFQIGKLVGWSYYWQKLIEESSKC